MTRLFAIVLSLVFSSVMAYQPAPVPPPPAWPSGADLPEDVQPVPEPEVTIVERGTETFYEYRIGGALYMVRVKPQVGPEYYYVDQDGDGMLETRSDDVRNIVVPMWVLFRW
jgi:hypothetical protein